MRWVSEIAIFPSENKQRVKNRIAKDSALAVVEQYTRIRVNSFDISGYKGECQGQGTDGIGLGVFRFEKQTKCVQAIYANI